MSVLGRYTELPPMPELNVSRLPETEVELTDRLPLLACVDALTRGTVESATPLTFEELGHDYGLAVYRTHVPGPRTTPEPLLVEGLRDRAHVFVDERHPRRRRYPPRRDPPPRPTSRCTTCPARSSCSPERRS